MTLLCDLPWLRVFRENGDALPAPPAAVRSCRDVSADPAALALVAEGISASHVVLVLPDILLKAVAADLSPDPVLFAAERPLVWPGENEVTGEADSIHGLWVVPPSLLKEFAKEFVRGVIPVSAIRPLVVPKIAATWTCGRSAEAAFRAGFTTVCGASHAGAAFSASLGSDRKNGVWWGIGACRGLLGGDADKAWSEERLIPLDEPSLLQRWHEIARAVRVEKGLHLHPLDARQAAAVRQMRGNLAPASIWDEFVIELQMLGETAERLATAYGVARAMIWGRPGDNT